MRCKYLFLHFVDPGAADVHRHVHQAADVLAVDPDGEALPVEDFGEGQDGRVVGHDGDAAPAQNLHQHSSGVAAGVEHQAECGGLNEIMGGV